MQWLKRKSTTSQGHQKGEKSPPDVGQRTELGRYLCFASKWLPISMCPAWLSQHLSLQLRTTLGRQGWLGHCHHVNPSIQHHSQHKWKTSSHQMPCRPLLAAGSKMKMNGFVRRSITWLDSDQPLKVCRPSNPPNLAWKKFLYRSKGYRSRIRTARHLNHQTSDEVDNKKIKQVNKKSLSSRSSFTRTQKFYILQLIIVIIFFTFTCALIL